MRDIEFLSYLATPTEKHIGIATVLYDHNIVLSYKINLSKEGNGFYLTPPSFKNSSTDEWHDWHSIDSRSKQKSIFEMIRNNIRSFVEEAMSDRLNSSIDINTGEVHGL